MNSMHPARLAAIIPVGSLEAAKTRLAGALDAEERHDLVERLLRRTVTAALAVDVLVDVLVVSPDREILQVASDLGARTIRQRSDGLNAGLREARADVVAGAAEALLVLPIDLAFVSPAELARVAAPLTEPGGPPVVVIVTDRDGVGTNVLGLRPPGIIDFAFGPDSRRTHEAAAEAARAALISIHGRLAFDIDTPADLVHLDAIAAGSSRAG